MSQPPINPGASAAERAARAHLQADHRAAVQMSMQAKRAGQLGAHRKSGGSEVVTALVVVVVVFAMLALVMRYGG